MHVDLIAMSQALQARGLPADRILSLHGQLDRPLLLSFLRNARRHMDGWDEGSLFIHCGGHGFFDGEIAETARPGLSFAHTDDMTDDFHLFWDEFFEVLDLPTGVHLTLLPDLWHSNLLAGRVPVNTSALVMCSQPGAELTCRGHNFNLPPGASSQSRGVVSYYAIETLAAAQSMGDWLARIETMVQEDSDAGGLPILFQPTLQVLGNPDKAVMKDTVPSQRPLI